MTVSVSCCLRENPIHYVCDDIEMHNWCTAMLSLLLLIFRRMTQNRSSLPIELRFHVCYCAVSAALLCLCPPADHGRLVTALAHFPSCTFRVSDVARCSCRGTEFPWCMAGQVVDYNCRMHAIVER